MGFLKAKWESRLPYTKLPGRWQAEKTAYKHSRLTQKGKLVGTEAKENIEWACDTKKGIFGASQNRFFSLKILGIIHCFHVLLRPAVQRTLMTQHELVWKMPRPEQPSSKGHFSALTVGLGGHEAGQQNGANPLKRTVSFSTVWTRSEKKTKNNQVPR